MYRCLSIGVGDDGDRRTSELGVPQNLERTQRGGSARLKWQVGGGEVTSITALRESETAEIYSNVGASFRVPEPNPEPAR